MTLSRGRRRIERWDLALAAVLIVAVVVPSATVLWFMNEALSNEASAAQQSVMEAYHGQLRLLRNRLLAQWQTRAGNLESIVTDSPAVEFQKIVASGVADSAVVWSRSGSTTYPSLATVVTGVRVSPLARDGQAEVRAALRRDDTAVALDAILRYFIRLPERFARDLDGQAVAADEQLLFVLLTAPSDPRRVGIARQLAASLNDYTMAAFTSAHRLFLMGQLHQTVPDLMPFPTLDAERLASAFLDTPAAGRQPGTLFQTSDPQIWQLVSSKGRVTGLYRRTAVITAMQSVLAEQSSGPLTFHISPPGEPVASDEAIAIGAALPGWEVAFSIPHDLPTAQATRGRRTTYVAIALLGVGTIAAAVVLIGGIARRQARLASLRTDLVSAVSHELKTPVTSLQLLIDVLRQDTTLDERKTRDYLGLMAVESDRLSRLAENFLTFARFDRGRQRLSFGPTCPKEIVDLVLHSLPEEHRGGARTPLVEVLEPLPEIRADRDALVTALLNLVDNAYKYSPSGGPVSIRAYRDASTVIFAVQDAGIGISPRDQKRVFRRYYRVDSRLASDTRGTGLGLSIVDGIVRAHGGRVTLKSAVGVGSTFSICLPLGRGPAAA